MITPHSTSQTQWVHCISSSRCCVHLVHRCACRGYWACWGEIFIHQRHCCVLLCIPESPTRETVAIVLFPFCGCNGPVAAQLPGLASISLGAAHTSEVLNAIAASLLTSLSENTSCCTYLCLAVPSLSFHLC